MRIKPLSRKPFLRPVFIDLFECGVAAKTRYVHVLKDKWKLREDRLYPLP